MSATPDELETYSAIPETERRPPSFFAGLGTGAVVTAAFALLLHVYVPSANPSQTPPLVAAEGPSAPGALRPATQPDELAMPAPLAPALTTPPGNDAVAGDLVVMPDLGTLRVPQARRVARESGLRLIIRDEYDAAIDTYMAPRYRIRSQLVAPGTSVPRGSDVRALAEDPSPIVAGY